MYRYDRFDAQLVDERVAQFRDQVRRRLSGALSEEEFRPLRLLNGLYLQLHAYMLRVAIPYGTVSATQMRMLAAIARRRGLSINALVGEIDRARDASLSAAIRLYVLDDVKSRARRD